MPDHITYVYSVVAAVTVADNGGAVAGYHTDPEKNMVGSTI